jgi:hypothetical protein
MKHLPGIQLAYLMALGAGILMVPAGSWANMGNQDSSSGVTMPAAGLRAGAVLLASGKETGADVVSAQQGGIAIRNTACQQDVAGGEYTDNFPAGRACITTADSQQPFSIQLGRQLGSRQDILGEFDGVRVDYRLSDALTLNGIAGYPVLGAGEELNPDRQVFGVSATTDQLARTWELNSYLVEQQENGRVVGRSTGGAIRYLKPGRSMLAYLDYDPVSSSVGTVMASGAVKLPFRTTVSATYDLQSRPIPGLQEQYLTQSMTVMDGWDWIVPDDRMVYHTSGGSSEVELFAVDLSYALSRRIKLRGDLVKLDITNEAIAATNAESSEYFYHLNLTGKDLIIPGDHNKLDLRRSVTETGRTYTASLDNKYTIKRSWNLISRLRADYHDPADDSSSRWAATPTVKMEYRPKKQFGFHIEAGGNVSKDESSAADDSRASYFVSLGYQAKF